MSSSLWAHYTSHRSNRNSSKRYFDATIKSTVSVDSHRQRHRHRRRRHRSRCHFAQCAAAHLLSCHLQGTPNEKSLAMLGACCICRFNGTHSSHENASNMRIDSTFEYTLCEHFLFFVRLCTHCRVSRTSVCTQLQRHAESVVIVPRRRHV